MNKRRLPHVLAAVSLAVFVVLGLASATGGRAPATFQRGAGGETSILLRPDLDFDVAFRELVFTLGRHGFQPEMMQPDAGFIRTQWNYQWVVVVGRGGVQRYRVRIVANFNPSRTQVIINPESEWYQGNGVWLRGWDIRAVETLRNDITMIMGN